VALVFDDFGAYRTGNFSQLPPSVHKPCGAGISTEPAPPFYLERDPAQRRLGPKNPSKPGPSCCDAAILVHFSLQSCILARQKGGIPYEIGRRHH
jgi:hypothetical protein